ARGEGAWGGRGGGGLRGGVCGGGGGGALFGGGLGRRRLGFVFQPAAQALQFAHGKLLRHGPLGQRERIGQADQGASLSRRKLALAQHLLHHGRQVEQSQRVGDVRPALADGLGDVVLRLGEIL